VWEVSLLVSPDRKGLALGLVGLVPVLPIVVFSMISGVVADAWDRRRLMLGTQIAATIVAVALGLLAFRGTTAGWAVYSPFRGPTRGGPHWCRGSPCRTRSA